MIIGLVYHAFFLYYYFYTFLFSFLRNLPVLHTYTPDGLVTGWNGYCGALSAIHSIEVADYRGSREERGVGLDAES